MANRPNLPEHLAGVLFLLDFRYGGSRRFVQGCELEAEQPYVELLRLGYLRKTVNPGCSYEKTYVTYIPIRGD